MLITSIVVCYVCAILFNRMKKIRMVKVRIRMVKIRIRMVRVRTVRMVRVVMVRIMIRMVRVRMVNEYGDMLICVFYYYYVLHVVSTTATSIYACGICTCSCAPRILCVLH